MTIQTLSGITQELQANLAPIGTFTFSLEGASSGTGKWMTVGSKSTMTSNIIPLHLPVNVEVAVIIFSNATDGATENVEFYKNGVLLWTMPIVNARVAYLKADNPGDLITLYGLYFAAGENLSLRIVNQGANIATDVIISMAFRLLPTPDVGNVIISSPTL